MEYEHYSIMIEVDKLLAKRLNRLLMTFVENVYFGQIVDCYKLVFW